MSLPKVPVQNATDSFCGVGKGNTHKRKSVAIGCLVIGSVEAAQSPGCCHDSGVAAGGSGGQLDFSLFN